MLSFPSYLDRHGVISTNYKCGEMEKLEGIKVKQTSRLKHNLEMWGGNVPISYPFLVTT